MRYLSFLCAALIGLCFSPSVFSADQGRKWAVVIGANEYLDPTIPGLKYCVADARRVFATLTKRGTFGGTDGCDGRGVESGVRGPASDKTPNLSLNLSPNLPVPRQQE